MARFAWRDFAARGASTLHRAANRGPRLQQSLFKLLYQRRLAPASFVCDELFPPDSISNRPAEAGLEPARGLLPTVLRELMRHESIKATMRYYVGQNAEATADELWRAIEPISKIRPSMPARLGADGSGTSTNVRNA